MKELIISNYDSTYKVSFAVIEDGHTIEIESNIRNVVNKFRKLKIWDEEYHMVKSDFSNANFQEYDLVIFCEDGEITIYDRKGCNT